MKWITKKAATDILNYVGGENNVFQPLVPAILGVLFYAAMERLFTKISPKPIHIFFVPMMSPLLTVQITIKPSVYNDIRQIV
ncbi:hypothetical protein LL037_04945 [Clostridium estertheticum]|uniref:hypothetical protein n=1 Tax=Clostridium estertheticum TaxID=238834 RepID=UPI001C0CA7C5|nr:hypothetical protein [Clostridium estertheticum]MBU3201390.1 hypothetical protein [Clostridium estertheticum]WAG66497.1 hypothetical protein LL037_04945 [Clostridium estertheticum]